MFKSILKNNNKTIHFLAGEFQRVGSCCLGVLCSKPRLVKWWSLRPVIVARLPRCRQGRDAGRRTRGQNFANIGYNERLHSQLSPPVEAAEAIRPPPDTECPSAPSRSHQSWSTLNLGRYYGTNCWWDTDGHMQWDLDPTRPIKTSFIVIFSKHLRSGEQYHDPENISIPLLCELSGEQ